MSATVLAPIARISGLPIALSGALVFPVIGIVAKLALLPLALTGTLAIAGGTKRLMWNLRSRME